MVPFKVSGGKHHRVNITFDSLFWFFVVTATATVVGELVYQKWVSPYLNRLPALPAPPALPPPMTRLPDTPPASSVVANQ